MGREDMPFSNRVLLLVKALFILKVTSTVSERFWQISEPYSFGSETSKTQSSLKDNFRKLNQMFLLKNILSLQKLQRMIPEHKDLMSEDPKEVFLLSPSVQSEHRNKMLPIPRIG